MWQVVRGVGLELDALLEVDEIKLDFLRAVNEGGVRDEAMQEGRLTGAGFAGHEQMLRSSFPQSHRLQTPRTSAADRHDELLTSIALPIFVFWRGNLLEGHFHFHGILSGPPGRTHHVVE